ncbi:hypothetical protein M3Y97_01049700 [Aphelenchoides bicaudatus]|nr:hypothetical protein M3Y97_01049700 [Aphelenchoides bicaudatus]
MVAKKMINPQNPFVSDSFLFINQQHIIYNESIYSYLHRFLNVVIPLMGLSTASMVIYLALYQTPLQIKAFARMLLVAASADILFSLIDLFTQTRYKSTAVAFMFTMTGPASLLSYDVQCFTLSIKSGAQVLGYSLLPISKLEEAIESKSTPPLTYMSGYIIICLLIAATNIWLSNQGFCTLDPSSQGDFGQYWYQEVPIPVIIVGSRSFVPLLTSVFPLFIPQFFVALDIPQGYVFDFTTTIMTLFPLFNSMASLFFIKPYRIRCIQMLTSSLFCKKIKFSDRNVIDVSPNTNQNGINRIEAITF